MSTPSGVTTDNHVQGPLQPSKLKVKSLGELHLPRGQSQRGKEIKRLQGGTKGSKKNQGDPNKTFSKQTTIQTYFQTMGFAGAATGAQVSNSQMNIIKNKSQGRATDQRIPGPDDP